jgi:MFS family permease
VFFNARFYYPVFTILFLDFGLTLEQFALLNVIWALTIVLLEVPSGALADTVGRRNLLICTAVFMVVEISLLCFAPRGNPHLLFAIFLVNRVLSGSAEAAASGADEALAYDSLKKEGDTKDWGLVLVKQMRFQSIGFIIALSVGGAVYDPSLMGRVAHWLGLNVNLNQDITLRFPLFLTLGTAIMALLAALRMKETIPADREKVSGKKCEESLIQALKLTLQAGRWILKTPFALMIISTGLIFDHIIRMLMTLSSQYYRLIDLPEATFGLIGSGLALLGLFVPYVALKLVKLRTPRFNLGIMAGLTLTGLLGMTLFLPILGLLPMVLLYSVMFLLSFFTSHYLNRITSSTQRATVLSFKGVSFNLAYGFIGLFYSLLLAMLRSRILERDPGLVGQGLENAIFIRSIAWFPGYFTVVLLALLAFAGWQLRNSYEHKRIG